MKNDKQATTDGLDTEAKDRAFSVAKATLSYIPFAGPALAELVSVTIPNQRMDRFAEFMRLLNERVETIESILNDKGKSYPERIALIETGAEQSSRARSNVRIQHIAALVVQGIDQNEQGALESHRILRILPQIDDQELLLLFFFGGSAQQKQDAYSSLNLPKQLQYTSSEELRKKHRLFVLGLEHLSDIGLLESKLPSVEFVKPQNRRLDGGFSLPNIKKRNVGKANAHAALSEYKITPLGRFLVEAVQLD